MGLGIKKEDNVLVIAGKDKGKKGRVIRLVPDKDRIVIEGINITKKHMKPNKQYTQGGIIDREGPIHISNVMLLCPRCEKPVRIANRILEDGKKERMCKKCSEGIN